MGLILILSVPACLDGYSSLAREEAETALERSKSIPSRPGQAIDKGAESPRFPVATLCLDRLLTEVAAHALESLQTSNLASMCMRVCHDNIGHNPVDGLRAQAQHSKVKRLPQLLI
jgi:hypothetical protein